MRIASDHAPDIHVRMDAAVVAMAREIRDGDLVAQGIGTILPMSATVLAMTTHAPRASMYMAIGNVIVDQPAAVTYLYAEDWALSCRACEVAGFDMNAYFLPVMAVGTHSRVVEWFRPAQIGPGGEINNHAVAGRLLPGIGGIPEMSTAYSDAFAYIPRHNRDTMVSRVEYITGRVGGDRNRPAVLVTDLGVFDWKPAGLTARSLHPGVCTDEVRDLTGFPVIIGDGTATTLVPISARSALDAVDPLTLRFLEALPARHRRSVLKTVAHKERTRRGDGSWPLLLEAGALGADACFGTGDESRSSHLRHLHQPRSTRGKRTSKRR